MTIRHYRVFILQTLILVSLVFCLVSCGKADNRIAKDRADVQQTIDEATPAVNHETEPSQGEGSDAGVADFSEYEAVLHAVPAYTPLEVKLSMIPDPNEWAVHYDWIVNDEHIQGIDSSVLPGNFTSPKAWIRCHVHIQPADSEKIFTTLRSNNISISALPPRLLPLSIPQEVNLPGPLTLQIRAIDPNEPEETQNRTLSYFLVEPETENILVNKETGEIRWMIDEETIGRLAPKLTIRVRVESSWGTSTTSSFDIPLSKEGQSEPEQPQTEQPETEQPEPEQTEPDLG